MKLISLHIKNFRSIKEAELIFQNKNYLILGDNRDDKGMDSNGAGKTHILDSIIWTLTNKSMIKNSLGDDIRRRYNDKLMKTVCKIVFKHRGKIYKIINNRPGKPKLFENGKEILKFNVFEYMRDNVLGIDYDTLKKIVILSERDRLSLCAMTDTAIKKLLDNIISGEIIETIDKANKENERNLKICLENINSIPSVLKVLRGDLKSLKEKLEFVNSDETYDNDVKNVRIKIKNNRKLFNKDLSAIKKLDKQKEKAGQEYESLEDEYINFKQSMDKERKTLTSVINDERKNKDRYKRFLDGFVTCPDCGSQFNLQMKKKSLTFEEVESLYKESKLTLKNKLREFEILNKEEDKERLEFDESLDKLREEYHSIDKQLVERRGLKIGHENEIKSNKRQLRTLLDNKDKMKNMIVKDILRKRNEIRNNVVLFEEAVKQQKLYKFWKLHLGKEGLKNYLYNKKLKLMQQYTNNVLIQLGINYRVIFDGFRKLKSGKYKNKVSVKILDRGDLWNYNVRSNGEQLRIDYASILAYRKMLSNKLGFSFNFMAFDELFNGFDKTGKEEIINLIYNLKDFSDVDMTLTISHDNEIKNAFKNIITVTKKNKISTIKQKEI